MADSGDFAAFPALKIDGYYVEPGMSLRQYAAIHLRVPESGDVWLDAMIERANREELAKAALQGLLADPETANATRKTFAIGSYKFADAMLSEGRKL